MQNTINPKGKIPTGSFHQKENHEHGRPFKDAHAELTELFKEFLEVKRELKTDKSPELRGELHHIEKEINNFLATHKEEHFGDFKAAWEQLAIQHALANKTKDPQVKKSVGELLKKLQSIIVNKDMSKFEGEDPDYYSSAEGNTATEHQLMTPKEFVVGATIGVLLFWAAKKYNWFSKA